jgi:hypothetical protein
MSIDDISDDGTTGRSLRVFNGVACQCASINGQMCSGHGTCMDPSMPEGHCASEITIPCTNDWQCETFNMGKCVYDKNKTGTSWRNGDGTTNPEIERNLGDEGGCDCYKNETDGYWDSSLFCEDCEYGYGPRKATTGDDFEASACDLSLTNPPLTSITHCTAPYGLDPILATNENAYKLCAGHGNYTGTNCTCFDNNLQGHWKLDVEDGAADEVETCRACSRPAYGPKPKNVADVESRLINLDDNFNASESCADKEIQACNMIGNVNPNKAVFEGDNSWYKCSDHGSWNKTSYECECDPAWYLSVNTGAFETDHLQSCNMCNDHFGPPVNDSAPPLPAYCFTDDEAFVPTSEQNDICRGFCAGPWTLDPVTDEYGLCSLHGNVNPEDVSECRCYKSNEQGFWKTIQLGNVHTCNVCDDYWGPSPAEGCNVPYGTDPQNETAFKECAGHGSWNGNECECDEGWALSNNNVCEMCNLDFGYGPEANCTIVGLYGFDPQNETKIYPDGWHECHGHGNIIRDESDKDICECNNSNQTGWFNPLTACAECAIDVDFPLHNFTNSTIACTPK